MRAITKYFWQMYYWLRPVTGKTSRTAYVKAACRMQGIEVVNHPVVKPQAVDYIGLGWVGVTESKICAEASCNHVYVPDAEGKCPKCGSQGIWISKTAIGVNRPEDRAGVKRLPKALTSRYWFNQYADERMNEVLRAAGFRLPTDLSAEEIYETLKKQKPETHGAVTTVEEWINWALRKTPKGGNEK